MTYEYPINISFPQINGMAKTGTLKDTTNESIELKAANKTLIVERIDFRVKIIIDMALPVNPDQRQIIKTSSIYWLVVNWVYCSIL